MIFYMNSKVFMEKYLEKEADWKILDSYYIIMSYRIKKKPHSTIRTIQNANNVLFPSSKVLSANSDQEFVELYKKQLSDANGYFATIIKGSIEKQYQFVILESVKESKMKHYKVLQDYIWETFGYPIFIYSKYLKGYYDNLMIDEDVVLERCEEELAESKKRQSKLQNDFDYRCYLEDISGYSKKKLKKEAKRFGIILGDESKAELLELVQDAAKNIYNENMQKALRKFH